jgi:glycosyltransferase involved in cell wall biosynthesis
MAEFDVSIVIPCLNEEKTLGRTLEMAREAIQRSGLQGEIVVADNGSTDASQSIAVAAGARIVPVTQRGYGYALIHGIRHSKGRYVVIGDADATYDFREAVPFLAALQQGADLVAGSRFKGGIAPGAMPFLHRWLGTPVLTFLINLFFGTRISDCNCGMRAFTRQAFDRMNLISGGMEFIGEMVIKAGIYKLKIVELPCSLGPDLRGKPPHLKTWRDGWRNLRFILLFAPHVVFTLPGWTLLVAGSLITLLVLPGQFRLGRLWMDYHYLFYSIPMILVGYQALWLAQFERYFVAFAGYFPSDPDLPEKANHADFNLELWLILGAVLVLGGLADLAYLVAKWVALSFGEMFLIRPAAVGMLLLLLGIQTIMSALMISMMSLKIDRNCPGSDA